MCGRLALFSGSLIERRSLNYVVMLNYGLVGGWSRLLFAQAAPHPSVTVRRVDVRESP